MPKNYSTTKIEPELLTVDQAVQRPLDPRRVNTILADFRRDSLGVIHVSERPDGSHHIVDGQHRVEAIRARGEMNIPIDCVLWTGLSVADEAALFLRLNNTRAVHGLHKFRVRVIEGDVVACHLNKILESKGWVVQGGKTEGSFAAVAALERLHRAGESDDLAESVIDVVTAAWDHNPFGVRAEILGGVGALLRRHPGLDRAKLISEMAQASGGPLGLVSKAKMLYDLRRTKIADAMAEVLVGLYNRKRTVNRLPAWREG